MTVVPAVESTIRYESGPVHARELEGPVGVDDEQVPFHETGISSTGCNFDSLFPS